LNVDGTRNLAHDSRALAQQAGRQGVTTHQDGPNHATPEEEGYMAISIPNTTQTRRNALTAIASMAGAVVTPAIAATVANPDAELLALGAQFDELARRLAIADKLDEPYQEAFQAALDRARTGLISNETFSDVLVRVEVENPRPSPSPDDITDAMDPIIRGIIAVPALSIAGMKVKARVAKLVSCAHFWNNPDNKTDWDKLVARQTIDAVLSLPETLT
jgi:hypothetical protein